MGEYYITHSDELYHHGILGQRWGVRRFQNEDGSLTSAGKNRYNIVGAPRKSPLEKVYKNSPQEAQESYRMSLHYALRDIKSLDAAPKLTNRSVQNSLLVVNNPNPKEILNSAWSRDQNCLHCSTAMVMREKGYDVKATGLYGNDNHGWTPFVATKMFDGAQVTDVFGPGDIESSRTVVNALERQGKDAYGILTVEWSDGGGHAMFYKNDENGHAHVYDGQCGKEYDIDSLLSFTDIEDTRYIRLDNCEPNENVLAIVEESDDAKKKRKKAEKKRKLAEKKRKEAERKRRKQAVDKAIKNATNFVERRARSSAKAVSNAANSGRKFVNSRAKNISKSVNSSTRSISRAVNRGKNFIIGKFGRKKKER